MIDSGPGVPAAAGIHGRRRRRPIVTHLCFLTAARAAACAALICWAGPARAWGDVGHEIIGLIAAHYLDPAVRNRVNSILAQDTTGLTSGTSIDQEATWADKYRDSDRTTTQVRYKATRAWHFVDLELGAPDLTTACFGAPPLPTGTDASHGAARDCVVDKIDEFTVELRARSTVAQERRLALQFLLHFVGDVHQPLHASDDHDQGGNQKMVSAPGLAPKPLHHYWDTEFVGRLGPGATAIAQRLISRITVAQRRQWSSGSAADWARESFGVARAHAYGLLPPATSLNHYNLSAAYVSDGASVTAAQLSKAGVRLAYVLNQALR